MSRIKPFILFAAAFLALVAICVLLAVQPWNVTVAVKNKPGSEAVNTQGTAVTENNSAAATNSSSPNETLSSAPVQDGTAQVTADVQTPVTVEPTTKHRENNESDITLNVELPSANGKIYVDTQPENKFIGIITDARGIDAEKLVAVYSLPDTGQNYVLEFDSAQGERTADSLVRVFLIDTKGKIVSVCSSDSKLCENVTSVENWFCMNVILKRMILPAINDRL